MKRALLSVSDKTGLVDFAQRILSHGFQLVSTGGTRRLLVEAGLEVTPVHEITNYPECFGGRVKTLHPVVHGGILHRRDHAGDQAERGELDIEPIDLVVVNLYPFRRTIAKQGVGTAEAIEQIDIGGPTMVRASAKNFAHVGIVVDPADYGRVADQLDQGGGTLDDATRAQLARKAFEHTAAYDAAISAFFRDTVVPTDTLPPNQALSLEDGSELRYGENPHQTARVYHHDLAPKLGGGRFIQGKPLSYNNLVDADGAVAAVAEFDEPTAVIVKHTNPCGVGRHENSLVAAYELALQGDPQSAFGGIISLNRPCDAATASLIVERFFEVVIAPAFEPDALAILSRKKNLRLLELDPRAAVGRSPVDLRWTSLGVLSQERDPRVTEAHADGWTLATQTAASEDDIVGLRFLWRVCKHVKSNAIVLGSHERTFGIGAGQMSRVDAVELALRKSTAPTGAGLLLASDAFFPFRDNIDVAAKGGVKAIVQPGGSRRDGEVIEACNELGIAMLFTGRRHFKH